LWRVLFTRAAHRQRGAIKQLAPQNWRSLGALFFKDH
jgi:hypothetical protein